MAAGDLTPAVRVDGSLAALYEATGPRYAVIDGVAWVFLPSGVGPARLERWEVVEHEDGTITTSPSIHDVGTPNGWHGYLERGVFREV